MITPLRNFGIVEENKIFRSAQPQYSYEYDWIVRNLKVKTIINIRKELDHDSKFAPQRGIKVVSFDIPDHHAPNEDHCEAFFKMLDDQDNFPMLFHCQHGQGRTSSFSVLCSLHAGMSLDEALEREHNDFGFTFKHQEQIDFLKSFYDKVKTLAQ